jgi:hypothetical protein
MNATECLDDVERLGVVRDDDDFLVGPLLEHLEVLHEREKLACAMLSSSEMPRAREGAPESAASLASMPAGNKLLISSSAKTLFGLPCAPCCLRRTGERRH